ncbi:hypothetical protein ACRS5S_08530 [Nocardia asiatica]|uniref:hypothetical protein n=1 Tax=Nocardia asiatica TaxID=209252 RepID=UPI003EE12DE0
MDDDQMGFDIEFDAATEAYLDWVAPERMESAIRKFLSDTVPGVAAYTDQWWKPPLTLQILEAAKNRFHDRAEFMSPENREAADGFIRFLGEACVRRHAGMTWTNSPDSGAPLYSDFGPAVHFSESGLGCELVSLAEELFMENFGPKGVEYSIRMAGRPA